MTRIYREGTCGVVIVVLEGAREEKVGRCPSHWRICLGRGEEADAKH